ncbi:MAG: response regulator, partial [Leptospiraceae bacterium]|nr:response regulator [Leptospiraceae bacterium]
LIYHILVHQLHGVVWIQGFTAPLSLLLFALLLGWSSDERNRRRTVEKELRQTNMGLKQALSEHSRFFSIVSHEFKTPLNAILGHSQLLLRSNTLDSDTKGAVTEIEFSGHHLLGLIQSLGEMSMVYSGRQPLRITSENIRSVLQHLVHMSQESAQEKGMDVRLQVDASVAEIYAIDRLRLGQVVLNLLNNAIKFAEQGSVVLRVGAASDESGCDQVSFSVEDDGPGIPPEDIDLIFEAFYQGDGKSKRSMGGVGLGLAISRNLVESMGGSLIAQNKKENGAIFSFTVPLQKSSPEQQSLPAIVGPNPGPLNVWLADDVPGNQIVLAAMLSQLGHRCEIFSNGQEVIQAIESRPDLLPDVLLIDLCMPVMGGLETIRRIQQRTDEWARLPIVAVTADPNEEKIDASECQIFGLIAKPIGLSALEGMLARLPEARQKVPVQPPGKE